MYPVPSRWPNRLWSIGAVFFGMWVAAHLALLAFGFRDQLGRPLLSLVGSLFGATMLFVLCVDRTSWSPAWLTRFLDRQLRRRPRSSD